MDLDLCLPYEVAFKGRLIGPMPEIRYRNHITRSDSQSTYLIGSGNLNDVGCMALLMVKVST